MNVDAAGVVYEGDADSSKLYAVANAPIFSYDDGFFGQEIVGGPMHSVSEGSRETAAVAVRILGGEKAGDIKTPPTGYATPKFDWRQLQRWKHRREPSAGWQPGLFSGAVRLGKIPLAGRDCQLRWWCCRPC